MPTKYPSPPSGHGQRSHAEGSPSLPQSLPSRPSPQRPPSLQPSLSPPPLPHQPVMSPHFRAPGPFQPQSDAMSLNIFPVVHATQLGWTPRTPVDSSRRTQQQVPLKKKPQSVYLSTPSPDPFTYHASHKEPSGASRIMSPAPPLESSPSSRAAGTQTPVTGPAATAQTPAWLKGAYTPRSSTPSTPSMTGKSTPAALSTTSPSAQNLDSWCKQRVEAIISTIDGSDVIPELKQIVDRLDIKHFEKQNLALRTIRKEKWAAKARARKAFADLNKAQKDLLKIDAHSSHIDAKIARLRSYTRFIDCGWREDEAAPSTGAAATTTASPLEAKPVASVVTSENHDS